MSWRTHPWMITLRRLARKLRINRAIGLALKGAQDYERGFRDSILALVRDGDCVWDVGANVGYYTKLFAQKVGQGGRVYAFEPDPRVLARLEQSIGILSNVAIVRIALSDRDGTMRFYQGLDPLGATGRLTDDDGTSLEGCIQVPVMRGDSVVARGIAPTPHVVKIDVEGFELEVLYGLGTLLDQPSLRAVGIEVHFGLLDARGRRHAPAEIERRLSAAGFRCRWTDYSHLVAIRVAL